MSRTSHLRRIRFQAAALVAAACLLWSATARAQTTEFVGLSSAGVLGNDSTLNRASITPDGRYIAFQSRASNLVAGDTNGAGDIFVRDRQTGTTTRMSVSSSGQEADAQSFRPTISADGRWVLFESDATNLVIGDTNTLADVFLHDRLTGQTTLRNVSAGGAQANDFSAWSTLSADGEWLAYTSRATTLLPLANNGAAHVYLQNRASGATTLVCLTPAGTLENSMSDAAALSADGRYVAFTSTSNNLTALNTGSYENVYVRDRIAGTTILVSPSSTGGAGNGLSQYPAISATGRVVTFQSGANNLIVGDTNNVTDVFVRDLDLGLTERVNVSSGGAQADAPSGGTFQPSGVSADGRYVAFMSNASNLVPGSLGWQAIYLRDRALGLTSWLSLSTTNAQANFSSSNPVLSSDGRWVVFQSEASNLVPGDTNGVTDLFLRGPLDTVWTNLGFSLAGTTGSPNLMGIGTLATGSPGSLLLSSARPGALCLLLASISSTPSPFKCGTLLPVPASFVLTLTTGATGGLALAWPAWPAGLSGVSLYFQEAIADPAAICGAALSNALRGKVP